MSADSPLSISDIIVNAANIITQKNQFVFGPAHDGGFYLFGGKNAILKNIWQSVAYSANTTLNQLAEKITPLGEIKFLETLIDVDYFEDLLALKKALSNAPTLLPQQQILKDWLMQL